MLRAVAVAAILAIVASGCRRSVTADPDAGTDHVADLSDSRIYFRSIAIDFGGALLPGVAVSVVDHPEIAPVLSDQNGSFAIPVPRSSVLQIAFDLDGYLPLVTRPLSIGTTDFSFSSVVMISTATTNALAAAVNQTLDPTKSATALAIFGPDQRNLSGATAVITPATGSSALYFSAGRFPDPSLTATSSSGFVAFINYAAGPATLTVTHPMYPHCAGEGADMPSPIPLQFIAGRAETPGVVFCGP